jgi:hypothetical protein
MYEAPTDTIRGPRPAPIEVRRGMYVARLECGHDVGPHPDYVGKVAKPGDGLVCRKGDCGGQIRKAVDVVCSGHEPDPKGRTW